MTAGGGLGTRTVRGMAWAYGAYVGGRALVLISTVILARLLTPRDFGVIALALVFITFLDAIKDFGLGQALIGATHEEEAASAQTVFGWTILTGLLLTVAIAAISPLAASFFHEDSLRTLLPVVGCTFLLRSLGATHYALARKRLNYRARMASEIAEVTVRGVISIALALAGAGVWSLVIGFVAGAATSSLTSWLLVEFHPRLRISSTNLRGLLGFGGVLTLVDISAVLYYNLDYVFVGRVLGASALGVYTIGFRIPELVILNLANVVGNVLFPAYSALDRGRLRDGYLVATRYMTMLTIPVAVWLIVLVRPLILGAFGAQWTESIGVARLIAIYALMATLSTPAGTVLKVTRQAKLMVLFSIPIVVILAVLLVIVTPHGIVAVAIATTVLKVITTPIQVIVVSRQLDLKLRATCELLVAPLVASAAMAAALLPLVQTISAPVPALLVGAVVGGVVYIGALWLLAQDTLRALHEMAFPRVAAG
jgi:O-antigen/teichoic acid export membrane protein